MAEREVYNYDTGQWETVDDQWTPAPPSAQWPSTEPYSPIGEPYRPWPDWDGTIVTNPIGAVPPYDPTRPNPNPPPPNNTTTPTTTYPTTYYPTTFYPTTQRPTNFGGSFDYGSFAWPHFNAQTFSGIAPFEAPPAFNYEPFTFEEFKAPSASEIGTDPSYTARRDEGLRAIEHGAAAKGLTRLPQTLKALAGWNQDFATREYGNMYDRAADTYDRNRNNAFGNWQANRNNAADAYSLNYGISRDVWDRNEQQAVDKYDRDYKAAYDSFDFNEWRPAQLTFADMYNRWRDQLDATTRIATAGAGA